MTSESTICALERRLRRKIARRQQLARWGKWLALPALPAAVYVGHWSEWLALAGVALFLLAILAIMQGELQRCPRCDASLVSGRGWIEQFEGTCPECGCPID